MEQDNSVIPEQDLERDQDDTIEEVKLPEDQMIVEEGENLWED